MATRRRSARSSSASPASTESASAPRATLDSVEEDQILQDATGQRFRVYSVAMPGLGRKVVLHGLDANGRFQFQAPYDLDIDLFTHTGDHYVDPGPDAPPAPVDPLDADNGWLDRDGRLYPCSYSGHRVLATQLCHHRGIAVAPAAHYHSDEEVALERAGWVKLSSHDRRLPWFLPERALTSAQIDVIRLVCTTRQVRLPYQLADDEGHEGFSLL